MRDGKPFRPRKDFSDFDGENLIYLEKLERFFEKYIHIKIEDFFEAPKKMYQDTDYPNLKYFTTRSAIKTYTTYKNLKEDENPEKQFNDIKKSIINIGKFCIRNNIEVKNYLKHKSGYVPSWILHYKERKINPYSIMDLGDFERDLYSLTDEEKDIYVKNLIEKVESYKVRYHNSPKTKNFVKLVTEKIQKYVSEYLQNKKNSDTI